MLPEALPVWPIVAVIPARGGSKRLPRKNILPFCGLPLLVHSIRFAQSIGVPHVVSTEDAEIKKIALQYGGRVIDRPAELADDDTPTWPVMQHALAEAEKLDGIEYQSLLLLQPTSPIRYSHDFAMLEHILDYAPGAVTTTANKVNGNMYLWRRQTVLSKQVGGMQTLEIPSSRDFDIDNMDDFRGAERALQSAMEVLPWLDFIHRDA